MSFDGSYEDHIRSQKLDSLSVSIFLNSQKDSHGGVAANIAYSLALLGDKPVLLGSVGVDGLLYMERLAHMGVDIKYVHESELPTAAFNVITDGQQNQIGGFYPGAMFDSDDLSLRPWKDSGALVVVSPHDPKTMRKQVAECVDMGLSLCYDIGQQVSNMTGDEMRSGIDAAEVLILNDYELTVLSEKTRLSIDDIKAKVPVVITTLGKEGSRLEGASVIAPISVGIALPTTVADPTGAGDAYRSGFLYGYARGWPLQAAMQLGAVCASYAIETIGTQTHDLNWDILTERHRLAFHDALPNSR